MKHLATRENLPIEVAELQKQLVQEHLCNKLLTAIIEVAEQELKIPIRKKYYTKQSQLYIMKSNCRKFLSNLTLGTGTLTIGLSSFATFRYARDKKDEVKSHPIRRPFI